MKRIRIGTRASLLARVQTDIVARMIQDAEPGVEVQLVPVTTLGDRLPPDKRADVEGKGAFTEDLETLLQRKEVDVAVHSMKDLPTQLAGGLTIAATPVRADPKDALVSREGLAFADLPKGAVLGTSSVRRKAQLRALRKDLEVVDLHGNVETRLSRMQASRIGGIVIAAAGLERLGRVDSITQLFSLEEMVPAPCQGTIALEARSADAEVLELLRMVDDETVAAETTCERSFAVRLGGDCDVPAGFCAKSDGKLLRMVGAVLSPDGLRSVRQKATADASDPAKEGTRFAENLLELGGDRILQELGR